MVGCMVEGDCEVVISWGLGHGKGSWLLSSTLYEIWESVYACSISLSHVVRCQNGLADSLANREADFQSFV